MRALLMLGVATLPALAAAQVQSLERVVLTASGAEQRVFETPFAVGVVDAEALRAAGPLVNLSEALARVPGLVVNARSNYAQDLQISSRGFGARASFGVRGLRLYSDGIPASGPDGQGQVSHFDLAGAQRVEVLRGPFSALYGASSGGAILLYSAAPRERRLLLDGDLGSDGLRQWRLGLELPLEGGLSLRAQFSRFETDGLRAQSAARRELANLRLGWEGAQDRLLLILNALDQPAEDPLGLTRAQFQADPGQTASVALPQRAPGDPDRFNTRKTTRQQQAGASWRHRFEPGGALQESQLSSYAGHRAVTQWQAIPVATQLNARHSGGVIDFERDYAGLDGRLVWRWALGGERQASLVLGAALDSSREDRQGYENFSGTGAAQLLGVSGRLRRDERNRLDGRDLYAQLQWDLAAQWAASLGLRGGQLEIESADRYIVADRNPDDSGRRRFSYRNPVAALQWRATPALNLYLSAGRGFEAPTLGELAYRSDGLGGFNTDLQAQTSRQAELGAKWRLDSRLALDLALFEARSADEIAVASNSGGRSSYRNVGRTRRRGAELELHWQPAPAWRGQLAATWLDARYRDGFSVCAAAPCSTPNVPVAAGKRIAGTQGRSAYAEWAWLPQAGSELALEAHGQGRVPVNDANSDFAAGFGLLALRAGHRFALAGGELQLLARLENLADRQVAGSVIVNEANGRFFEPAQGRSWLLSARWSGRW